MQCLFCLEARFGIQAFDIESLAERYVCGGHVVGVHEVCGHFVAWHGEGP